MPLTQSQLSDIKQLIRDTVKEIFSGEYLKQIIDSVIKTSGVIEMQEKISQQQTEITELKTQCARLNNTVNQMERRSRNLNVRVFGITESRGEDLERKVVDVINSKLEANISVADIEQCYRINSTSNNSGKPAPIFLRFSRLKYKETLLRDRKRLKGTDIVITEDLMPGVYELFKNARKELGRRKVWTLNGRIFTMSGNVKVEISSRDDVINCKKGRHQVPT